MGALKRLTDPTFPPVKMTAPVSAGTPGGWPAPSAPTAQTMLSAALVPPGVVVVTMVEPSPFMLAHQATEASTGAVLMRTPTMPFATFGHRRPNPVKAMKVPAVVLIAEGAVTMGPLETCRTTAVDDPTPPRCSGSTR